MNNLDQNRIIPAEKQVEVPAAKPVEVITTKPPIEVVTKPLENYKNNNNLYTVIAIVIGILVLFGASYVGRSITSQQNKLNEELNTPEIPKDFTLNDNTCYDRFNYLVVTRVVSLGDSGEDILVKYKTEDNQNIECEYNFTEGDFEIPGSRSDDSGVSSHSQYFSYIKDNFLIINEGTGTSRVVRIFDLEKRKEVSSGNYHGELDLRDNILTYWRITNDVPNKENCSKIDEYKKSGVGAQIETKVSLNLNDLTKKEFEEFKCLQAE